MGRKVARHLKQVNIQNPSDVETDIAASCFMWSMSMGFPGDVRIVTLYINALLNGCGDSQDKRNCVRK